jgi:hypothetical protein
MIQESYVCLDSYRLLVLVGLLCWSEGQKWTSAKRTGWNRIMVRRKWTTFMTNEPFKKNSVGKGVFRMAANGDPATENNLSQKKIARDERFARE